MSEGLLWLTCLRSLVIGVGDCLDPSEDKCQIYLGRNAYQFCLELVCGLHSPIIGETEVFGQFKELIRRNHFQKSYSHQRLKAILEGVCKDAKKVRQDYFLNMGSQSYGSVVRKLIRSKEEVHILGAGRLAQEILPWIKKATPKVHLHCRDPIKLTEDKRNFQDMAIHSLHKEPNSLQGTLIIAAPLSSQDLLKWIGMAPSSLRYIIDLRGESIKDPLPLSLPIKQLGEIFLEVEKNRERLSTQIKAAQSAITHFAIQWDQRVQIRPFGWDDVCA